MNLPRQWQDSPIVTTVLFISSLTNIVIVVVVVVVVVVAVVGCWVLAISMFKTACRT